MAYEFDPVIRNKAREYARSVLVYRLFNFFLMLAFIIVLAFTWISLLIKNDITRIVSTQPGIDVLYFCLFITWLTLLSLPISYNAEYINEHLFGVSNLTTKTWAKDQIKGYLLSLIISIPLLLGLYHLIRNYELWWLFAGVAYFLLTILFVRLAPVLLLPLFYRVEKFENHPLAEKLKNLASKAGVKIVSVEKLVASERTKKPNAVFTGIGERKRILLFDTLLESFPEEEIEIVLGHELGHYANGDIYRYIVIDGALSFPGFFLADHLMHYFSLDLADVANFPKLVFILLVFSLISSPMVNAYLRSREKLADNFALEQTWNADAFISNLKRLADLNLLEIEPHRLKQVFFSSHPSIKARIEYAEAFKRKQRL